MVKTGSVLVDIQEHSVPEEGISSNDILASENRGAPKLSVPSLQINPAAKGQGEAGRTPDSEVLASPPSRVMATPAIRRLSRELKIDLSHTGLKGSGPGGRILKGDLMALAKQGTHGIDTAPEPLPAAQELSMTAPAADPSQDTRVVVEEEEVGRGTLHAAKGEEGDELKLGLGLGRLEQRAEPRTARTVPIKGLQRAMMESMRKAMEIPHMTFCDEVKGDGLLVIRSHLKHLAEAKGLKLSYLPFIVKATSMALKAYPLLNASISEDQSEMIYHADHNIGVAMDTERGLLVPNISSVQDRSILEITEELNALQRLGTVGKLGEAELKGTTFTLSNIGSIGGTYASPIIASPQVCIGAIGRMQKLPRYNDDGNIVPCSLFSASWSADHRVVDGSTIASFSNLWKGYLENPSSMLAEAR
ncbi:unnamed protein product [Discosporangium mesarthrocarpum]